MKTTWLGLGFALVAGAGFEAAGAVAGPFLIDSGLARSDVGRFLALPAVAAMLFGALAGGYLSDRFGRARMTTLFLVGIALGVAGLALVAPLGPTASMVMLGAVYLGIGLFTAASYALFMDLTLPRLGGTQFSTYMAATNACESWSTLAVGRLSGRFGYALAFGAMATASLLALPMLFGIARRMRGREATPEG